MKSQHSIVSTLFTLWSRISVSIIVIVLFFIITIVTSLPSMCFLFPCLFQTHVSLFTKNTSTISFPPLLGRRLLVPWENTCVCPTLALFQSFLLRIYSHLLVLFTDWSISLLPLVTLLPYKTSHIIRSPITYSLACWLRQDLTSKLADFIFTRTSHQIISQATWWLLSTSRHVALLYSTSIYVFSLHTYFLQNLTTCRLSTYIYALQAFTPLSPPR